MSNLFVSTTDHAMTSSKSYIGFWAYLMTDCILFGTLFATFIVLRGGMHGGSAGGHLFDLDFVLIETMLLLTSSFTCGLALIAAHANSKKYVLTAMTATFALGAGFLGMELFEFTKLVSEGYGWQTNGFLSAFFTLVGTHGLHITIGLLWILVMGVQIARVGLGGSTIKRLTLFSLFWHFLDVIWILIFTIVYLQGVL